MTDEGEKNVGCGWNSVPAQFAHSSVHRPFSQAVLYFGLKKEESNHVPFSFLRANNILKQSETTDTSSRRR